VSRLKSSLNLLNRTHLTPILYALSGITLLFVLIIIFQTYVLRLKVETAVVSSQIETMVAPVNGYITHVFVAPGGLIKKGAPLLSIENLDLERKLQLARIQVAESQLNIDYYKQLLVNEQQRLSVYKQIGATRVDSALTLVNQAKQTVLTAQHEVERFTELNKKHYVSAANLETVRANYLNAQEALNNANARHQLENHSLDAVKEGMYFTGTKTEGIARDLDAELTAAQNRVKLNEMRVKIYEELINKLTLTAPFDGKVTQILKSVGNTTDMVQPLIFIENVSIRKQIIAYLTQDEIIHIGASGNVKLYIPSSGKIFHGKIVEINRTDGFIDEVNAQYRWRDFQVDRSARITIAIKNCDQKAFDHDAFSGMPVIAYFSKKFLFF
jgi:multidrug resistance efflux pump